MRETLRHPLVIALVTLAVGTGLLGYWDYLRRRSDEIRDLSLGFIDEVAAAVNAPMPLIFGPLRRGNPSVSQDLHDRITDLYALRMQVQVKSTAYLESEVLSEQYGGIARQIYELMRTMETVEESHDVRKAAREAREHVAKLKACWGLEPGKHDDLAEPYPDLLAWADLIWMRSAAVLTCHTQLVLRSRPPRDSRLTSDCADPEQHPGWCRAYAGTG
jgi:hypothetical protein